MSWAAVIVGGASLIGGVMGSDAAGDAADAQTKGNTASIAEQRRQFDTIMQMLQPQRQLGANAMNAMNQLYGFGDLNTAGAPAPTGGTPGSSVGSTGIGVTPSGGVNFGVQLGPNHQTSGTPNTPRLTSVRDAMRNHAMPPAASPTTAGTGAVPITPQAQGAPNFNGFFTSPDYTFRRDEGTRDIQNSFAAGGGARSGNALRRLAEYNSSLASGEFGGYFNRLASMAGMGQTATSQGVGAAQSTGANIGNALVGSGNARASGITGSANAWGDALSSGAGMAGYYLNNKPRQSGGYWV